MVIYFYGDKGTKHFLISNKKCEAHGGRKLANEVRAAQAVVARRAINFGKVYTAKVIHLSYRKETEKNGRGSRGNLMKKGYEKGGVSL
ncbi:hypothetical protein [Capnocytophaga sp. oral taxon 864]|uniref:hypothetical protein n=1 Tax=Capnocytophaga sp. oral taxon 864 TaxID=1316593 RepID=UPI0013EA5453|nr:hypothetical protein [Capnocytophaga sp. oral taxon 864]